MNSGIARLLVVVAFVASCWLILANGYGGSVGGLAPVGTHSPKSPHSHTRSPHATPSPQVQGVEIAVFNGTTTPNLAERAQLKLSNAHYVVGQPASNSPTQGMTQTIVYYRAGTTAAQTAQSKANALGMVHTFFPGAKILKLGAKQDSVVHPNVQLAIFLGSDYKG